MHDGSGAPQHSSAVAGCCLRLQCCSLRCLMVEPCRAGFDGGDFHGDVGDGGCWHHAHCLYSGTGSAMKRPRKRRWWLGLNHLWTLPHRSPTCPSGRPVPGSPCFPCRCSSTYRVGWWWCRRGRAAECTPRTSADLPLLKSSVQGRGAQAW